MSRPSLRTFEAADVAAAGALLAARHAAHVRAEPLLDARYAVSLHAEAVVRDVWESPGSTGAVAVQDGRLVGYILGGPKSASTWGDNVWVDSGGFASDDPELVRDLYGMAAQAWVGEGAVAHYVVVPAHDPLMLDAWYRLGFGQQHAHAVREVPSVPAPTPATVRRATADDVDVLARLDLVLPTHQGLSPVFSSGQIPTFEQARAEWRESIVDERFATFVAELGGEVVGSAIGCSLELSSTNVDLIRPPHAGFLGFAAVLPEARGSGLGRALGEAVISWAARTGFTSVATDWRVTNLLSSRTWPRLGFRPTFLRLHRAVGY